MLSFRPGCFLASLGEVANACFESVGECYVSSDVKV